ncbi:LysR family transcriptional regulator [Actinoplanes sp. RD1]|uniref:LysR family transcriptional regulator n=1 Tax=Actinoplanes sp. RD1 TaxID=3064538 RepID=UPI0027418A87|nr:LysR family transcriptional regulator [Actinoplanes sp. RD1]
MGVVHNMSLRQLGYLVAVADEGGFSQAAQRLHMTQPALSRAVQLLEQTLGVALVVRVHRGVELTAAGEVLVARARVIADQVESAVLATRAAADGEPDVRVSTQGCELTILQGLIRTFGDCFPDVVAAPFVTERAVDMVVTGDADLALVRGPFDDRGTDSEVLDSHPRVAVLPVTHPLASRGSISRAELAADPVIGWPVPSPAERAYWLGADGYAGTVIPGPEVRDLFHLINRVQAGEAVAFLPARVQQAMAIPPDIRLVPVTDLLPEQLRLVWPAQETSPSVARFVRHAASQYEPE